MAAASLAACVPGGESTPGAPDPICTGCDDPPRRVVDAPLAPPADATILVGAGQDVLVVRDADGAILARRTLDVDDGAGPWPVTGVASVGRDFVVVMHAPDDEGGVLFRGAVSHAGIGVAPSGWSAAPIGLATVDGHVVLFEGAPGDRWRTIGSGAPSSLPCPVPSWIGTATGHHTGAWATHDGAAVAIQVTTHTRGLVACTTNDAVSLRVASEDRIVAVAGAVDDPVAVVRAREGLALVDASGRVALPGTHVAGIALTPAPAARVAYVLVGDEAHPDTSVLVAHTAQGTSSIPLAGAAPDTGAVDRIVAHADGATVGIDGAVVRVALGGGVLAIRHRVRLPGDAHVAGLAPLAPRER